MRDAEPSMRGRVLVLVVGAVVCLAFFFKLQSLGAEPPTPHGALLGKHSARAVTRA